MTIQLWHCKDARSLRPLWALEEMDIEYQLHVLPFPPRFRQPDYLDVNPLGTVPFMLAWPCAQAGDRYTGEHFA
jgi:glutathione S-transferase